MSEDTVHRLEREVLRLMSEVDRYRTATEDALEQVSWCIGYLAATRKDRLAASLSLNRDHIRSNLLSRAPQSVPNPDGGQE